MIRNLWLVFFALAPAMGFASGQTPSTVVVAKPSRPVTVQPWVLQAKLTHEVAPEYPTDALEHHAQGPALVQVVVDEKGNVQKASGIDCPNCSPIFQKAAVQAVQQWQYQPTLLDGKPVSVSSEIIFRFRLENGPFVEVLSMSKDIDVLSSSLNPPPAMALDPWILHEKLKHPVAPEYPATAIEANIQGGAFVQVVVDEKGKVQNVIGMDCPGCSPILREAAVKTVEKWEYEPTLLDGKPVSVSSWIIFRFRLENGHSVEVVTKSESSALAADAPKFDGWIFAVTSPEAPRLEPQKLRISPEIMERNLVHKVNPDYPPMAKIAHLQGDVVLQCSIDKEGNIEDLHAISGPPILIQAALDAVKKWKYKPLLLNGQPVKVETTITVRFRM